MIADKVSDYRLTTVYPDVAERWLAVREEFWDVHNLQLRVSQALRTFQEQWAIYAQGRRKNEACQWIVVDPKKVVTNAKGGESLHNYGLALDSAFMGDDPFLDKSSDAVLLWVEYGKICEKNGLEWGGRWKAPDRPHCERTYGLSLGRLQVIHEGKGIKGVFEKCNQIISCGKETTL